MTGDNQKQYLTYIETASLTGFKVGTLRNFVSKGILKLKIHYLKPRGGKVLFIREAIEGWLAGHMPEE